MSQIYLPVSSTPAVATTYVTDSGNAVPAANILNVLGAGGVTTSGAGNTITITFSETTVSGTGTTVGAVTADLISITPTVAKAFTVQVLITGYDAVNNTTVGGELIGGGTTSAGGAVSLVDSGDLTKHATAASGLDAANMQLIASGANLIVRVTGVAAHTIAWRAVMNYILSP